MSGVLVVRLCEEWHENDFTSGAEGFFLENGLMLPRDWASDLDLTWAASDVLRSDSMDAQI